MFEKIWEAHEVSDGLIYIDLHLVHEVTSPQAFDGLRLAGRKVRRPDRTLATADHNIPTDGSTTLAQINDALSRKQIEVLENNCAEFGVPVYSIGSEPPGHRARDRPGAGHHPARHDDRLRRQPHGNARCLRRLAFGIGTSEVEHVLATQTLPQRKPKAMRINYPGELGFGVTPKDLILATIGQIGVDGGVGYVIEYAGERDRARSNMEGRMTICNMTIEAGGRAGLIAPDETTFEWVKGREAAPAKTSTPPSQQWKQLSHRRRRDLRQRDRRRRHRRSHRRSAGAPRPAWSRRSPTRCPIPTEFEQPRRPRGRRARAGVHGPDRRHADPRDQARPRLHRQLHQQPHRRPALPPPKSSRAARSQTPSAAWSSRAAPR